MRKSIVSARVGLQREGKPPSEDERHRFEKTLVTAMSEKREAFQVPLIQHFVSSHAFRITVGQNTLKKRMLVMQYTFTAYGVITGPNMASLIDRI